MWVVKIGGSLCADPVLPQWLDLLTQIGGGRVTVVCGGGTFADEVRRVQAHWQFNDLAAHNMAVLAMAQTAYQLHALNPALQLAARKTEIPDLLRRGKPRCGCRSSCGATSRTAAPAGTPRPTPSRSTLPSISMPSSWCW
uniref:Aspartokinase uridylate kinase-like putative kinase n=1 Tax=Variovorax paradoxus (strain S110) TaxID=543728 RepID=C5CPV1_VARPS